MVGFINSFEFLHTLILQSYEFTYKVILLMKATSMSLSLVCIRERQPDLYRLLWGSSQSRQFLLVTFHISCPRIHVFFMTRTPKVDSLLVFAHVFHILLRYTFFSSI